MFKFLKDKLKQAISKFTKEVETEPIVSEQMPDKVQEDRAPEDSTADSTSVKKTREDKSIKDKAPPAIISHGKAVHGRKIIQPKTKSEAVIKQSEPRVTEEKKAPETSRKEKALREHGHDEIPTKTEVKPLEPAIIASQAKKTSTPPTLRAEVPESEQPKKGFFARITERVTTTAISDEKYDELFWDLEVVLLENNVAVEIIERIKDNLRKELVHKKVKFGKTEETIRMTLTNTIEDVLKIPAIDLFGRVKAKQPYIILFVGVNGVGKTTTIAKVAHHLQKHGLSSVIAAADTFRAAAIQQLEEHADRLKVKLIKHDYGADPAAVAYDAIQYATAKHVPVVLIDTAGRQHSNANLMQEMQKMVRVAKPDLKIFVGESITGNDCIEQAREFSETIGIDAIILSKADVDEKGGTAISISYLTKKPILFIGTGQGYDALEPFQATRVLESLGLEA
jgi:fused signal recognition particle receptor